MNSDRMVIDGFFPDDSVKAVIKSAFSGKVKLFVNGSVAGFSKPTPFFKVLKMRKITRGEFHLEVL